jgi:hypothetical protein
MAARPPRDRSTDPPWLPGNADVTRVDEDLRALVRLLARQAARECFDRELAQARRQDIPRGDQ